MVALYQVASMQDRATVIKHDAYDHVQITSPATTVDDWLLLVKRLRYHQVLIVIALGP